MGQLKNLFEKKELGGMGYTQKRIDLARQKEPENYLTLCQKLFYGKVYSEPVGFSNKDPSISDFDKMILPIVETGSLLGMFGGGIPCDENCLGYTPIPVEEFSIDGDDIRCQRCVPKPVLDKFGGWEKLRNHVLNFNKEKQK